MIEKLSIEVRRENWGWFGEPWRHGGTCYDADGKLCADMQKPFPAGEQCLMCGQTFVEGDSGMAMPMVEVHGNSIRHVHKECQLRSILGTKDCYEGVCNGPGHDHGNRPFREEALELWEHLIHD